MTPSTGIHSGDTVALDTKIANIGSVDAPIQSRYQLSRLDE